MFSMTLQLEAEGRKEERTYQLQKQKQELDYQLQLETMKSQVFINSYDV